MCTRDCLDLQAKTSSQWRAVHQSRKITPSATAEPTQGAPPQLLALLQPAVSAQQQKLQAAFLDQYSAAEDKVHVSLAVLGLLARHGVSMGCTLLPMVGSEVGCCLPCRALRRIANLAKQMLARGIVSEAISCAVLLPLL